MTIFGWSAFAEIAAPDMQRAFPWLAGGIRAKFANRRVSTEGGLDNQPQASKSSKVNSFDTGEWAYARSFLSPHSFIDHTTR